MKTAADFLVVDDPIAPCDLIVVLAGKAERKEYGLKLLREGVAPRLLLSVSRFDVRHTATMLTEGAELIALRNDVPPHERHFWVDFEAGRPTIARAAVKGTGTYAELQAMAAYLTQRPPARIGLISTSIHLRRIRFCCSRIPFFKGKQLYLWAVPDELSSFQLKAWWKRPADWLYLISEYAKLVRYYLIYGW